MEQALDFNLIIAIAFGILGIVLIAFLIALPFAVFSIRQRLDETNRHLEAIVEQLRAQTEVERLELQPRATLDSKEPARTPSSGRVTRLFRGQEENDEDD